MASIPSLNSKIAAADATGVTSWGGTNGIEAQMTEVSTLLLERGVVVVANTTTLALMGASDARIAIVKGTALYAYNAAPTGATSRDIPSSGGGRWQYLCRIGVPSYTEVIGDSSTTTFTITHDLGTFFPNVTVWEASSPGQGAPYTQFTPAEIIATSDSAITVRFTTAPGTFQYTVSVTP